MKRNVAVINQDMYTYVLDGSFIELQNSHFTDARTETNWC